MKPTRTLDPEHCAESLKALGDPIRLRIIAQLRTGPQNVGELAAALENTAVTISHHLAILYHSGFVRRAKRGRFVEYRLERNVFVRTSRGIEHIDLHCCRLELPPA
jgi:DNA-binding transcriptional ArsR family regulator